MPRQDIEDNIRRVNVLAQRLLAGCLDRGQPVAPHGGQNADHLPVAIGGSGQLPADPLQPGREHPVLERRAIAQGAGLTGR